MKAAPHIKTPAQYIASLPSERQAAMKWLHAAITKAAPNLEPFIVHGMIGYGPYHYRYASGREGDSAHICLASQKQYISLYLGCDGDGYLAEKNAHRLGNVSVGKSCIRFRKLGDLDIGVAMELVKKAAERARKPRASAT